MAKASDISGKRLINLSPTEWVRIDVSLEATSITEVQNAITNHE